jgi:hypothetical protein
MKEVEKIQKTTVPVISRPRTQRLNTKMEEIRDQINPGI